MKHLLDGGATRCSCKGGGCKICNANDSLVNYHNKIIQLGVEPNLVQENLDEVAKRFKTKVDPYLVWDKLVNGVEFSDDIKEAISNNKTLGSTVVKNKISVVADSDLTFAGGENPNKYCDFDGNPSPWARCKYCNSIQRYVRGETCPNFKGEEKNNDL